MNDELLWRVLARILQHQWTIRDALKIPAGANDRELLKEIEEEVNSYEVMRHG